jgi:sRNA-binding protein
MKRTGTSEALTEWLPNHHYIYTIRLRANRIDFEGYVAEWGDTDTIDGIEIKEE